MTKQAGARGGSIQVPPDDDCTPTALFELLWGTLVDAIGPTATAALLQRSSKRAAARHAPAGDLIITREQFVYGYKVPPSWTADPAVGLDALRALSAELCPLLSELTGPVVVRRLAGVRDLARCGVLPEAEQR